MRGRKRKSPTGRMTEAVDALQKRMILEALKPNTTLRQTADYLGIREPMLRLLMKRYGIRRTVKVIRTAQITVAKQ